MIDSSRGRFRHA